MATNHYRIDVGAGVTPGARRLYDAVQSLGLSFENVNSEFNAMVQGKSLPGTLTTRTDNDTGVITLSADHQVAVNDIVTVTWSGGSRTGMTVTAVTGAAVTVDGGTGTVLPSQGEATMIVEHYKVVADLYAIKDDASPTPAISKTVAKALYDELNSFIGNCAAALRQLVSRVK